MKWLIFLTIFVGCNKSQAPTKESHIAALSPAAQSCLKYKKEILQAAVTEKSTPDDVIYSFNEEEVEALKYLNQYTTKNYLLQNKIETLKALASACTPEKLKQWQDSYLNNECNYDFIEYQFFISLINNIKIGLYSPTTRKLAVEKSLEMIRFYVNKDSTLLELSLAHMVLEALILNNLVSQKIQKELLAIETKITAYHEELRSLKKAALGKETSCSDNIYLKEFSYAQEINQDMRELIKKVM